jgi:hypothetical protein
MIGSNIFFSHFSAIRDYKAWTVPELVPAQARVEPDSLMEQTVDKHPVFVILFDSDCDQNKIPHLKRYKGKISNYDFTVKQRLLARDAKVPDNLQDLESSVSLLLCVVHLWPNLVKQLDEILKDGYKKKNGGFVRLNPDLFIGW